MKYLNQLVVYLVFVFLGCSNESPIGGDAQNNSLSNEAQVVLAKAGNLVAYYKFDGNFEDSSENKLHGTPNGDATIAFDAARHSKVLVLDGDGDYVDVGNSTLFDWSGGFTAAFWVKVNAWQGNWDTVLKKADAFSFERLVANDDLSWFFQPAGGSQFSPRVVPLAPDGWHHIAGTYDGTDQSIYLDGALFDTVNNPGAMPIVTDNFLIGAANGPPIHRFFNGCLDDVLIFNVALTARQIAHLALARDR